MTLIHLEEGNVSLCGNKSFCVYGKTKCRHVWNISEFNSEMELSLGIHLKFVTLRIWAPCVWHRQCNWETLFIYLFLAFRSAGNWTQSMLGKCCASEVYPQPGAAFLTSKLLLENWQALCSKFCVWKSIMCLKHAFSWLVLVTAVCRLVRQCSRPFLFFVKRYSYCVCEVQLWLVLLCFSARAGLAVCHFLSLRCLACT